MFSSIIGLGRLEKAVLVVFSAISSQVFAQGVIAPGPAMNLARSGHTATLLADGTVLIAGGNSGLVLNAETYDPSTGALTPTGPMVNDYATATLLPDGRVLLVGAIAQLYNPSTRTFAVARIGTTDYGCAATLLNNGKVLFTGDPPPYGPSATAELYDPETGNFAPTGQYASIEIARMDHATGPSNGGSDCRRATLLANGTILVVVGIAAEIHDPQTNAFSLTGTLTKYPSGLVSTLPLWQDPSRATLLLNGMVLFSGGDGDLGPSSEAWLYDLSTGTFQPTGPMITPRAENTVTLLPDGTVFAAGSYELGGDLNPNPRAIGATEFYDSTAATFFNSPDRITPRFDHTATLLADGRVFIAGGTTGVYAPPGSGYSVLSTTELYTPRVVIPAPRLFSLSGDGRGQGAIWNSATGIVASPGSPAVAGDILSMYTSNLAEGGVIPPHVIVGCRLAEILYFGSAPGYPGYYQVNFRVPSGVAPGSAVPVRSNYLNRTSNKVTIGLL